MGQCKFTTQPGKKTLFAINHWAAGDGADIGIGNSGGTHRDWTFSSNAGSYSAKTLKVYVRPQERRQDGLIKLQQWSAESPQKIAVTVQCGNSAAHLGREGKVCLAKSLGVPSSFRSLI